MAWGLWNKIKQGFKKVGGAIKKAASFVNDKIIKPFKPVISKVADTIIPGSGRVVEAVSDGIDGWTESTQANRGLPDVANGNFRGAAQRVVGMTTNRPGYKKLNF